MARGRLPSLPLPPKVWARVARELMLSPRQKEIVELILRNQCDKQIMAATGLKHPTLRTHCRRIFERTGAADRYELLILVMRLSHQLE